MLRILLVGVGGYGSDYTEMLLDEGEKLGVTIAGAVDPFAKNSRIWDRIEKAGFPIYNAVEDFYSDNSADLALIATPIQFHCAQAIYCMEHGSDVLCEKPAAATVEDALKMLEARNRTGRKLQIGFQWCWDPSMLRFKDAVSSGELGKPLRMKGMVVWPRSINYYKRGMGWAGKKYSKDGAPVFDNVVSNATAHYLENIMWIADAGFESMTARTARANDIETFDTCAIKGTLTNGARVFFLASHATGIANRTEPMFVYEFEKATVTFTAGSEGGDIVAAFKDGTVKNYGFTTPHGCGNKLRQMIDLVRGADSRFICPLESAIFHTRAMQMMRESCPEAEVFENISLDETNNMLWVPGLNDRLNKCWETESIGF